MRFNAQTVTIENGFVYLPSAAPWLAEFVREIITFPASKYDDQTDSTSQELAWLNSQPPGPGIIGFYRRENALRMRANGDSIEKIAGFLKSTPEEVQRWFKEDAERNVRMQRSLIVAISATAKNAVRKFCRTSNTPKPEATRITTNAAQTRLRAIGQD